MTNKLGSSNPNRIPRPMNEQLKDLNYKKGLNVYKDRRKKNRRNNNRRIKHISITFTDRRIKDRRNDNRRKN
ncbi:MAG: hypothetical protein CMG50_03750 [Candidatus Marinimicrobia bacterium]|nr:hypothetical protein [Candidatus Neomarinimicrobiota bacterium]|tara:strand:- start:20212 stop:20427 length:216 start_codon:yes stop_codon:yes gene_type:complete